MGLIKDRNGMDLTEAEDIKSRCQEYTEELYKRDLHDPDNHSGVITHLEPNILEFEVKWALGSITTNKTRGNWKILKEMGVPDHLTCPLINLYPDQEATARNGYGTMNWF